uniref:Methionine synthase II (Cobalamin-independent) n=1 Tax=Desulfacinum infernum TaxID=35837 RepID=A0A831ZYG3_9BACT
MELFQAAGQATLVGSMPHADPERAVSVVLDTMPHIPVWPQLPKYPAEQMMVQYLEGLPGVRRDAGRVWVDTEGADEEILSFYEDYLAVDGSPSLLDQSRFAMGEETGRTFRLFLDRLAERPARWSAVKGQIVGPFTLLSGLTDQGRRALLFDERMRDVVVKHLAMKGLWQVRRLARWAKPVILFLDEPALAGFGTSAFITVSAEDIKALLTQVAEPIRKAGALVGVHVCANTDWGLIFDCPLDIINLDAYQFFDRFALYRTQCFRFLDRGGIVAWGMVPTADEAVIDAVSAEDLAQRWTDQVKGFCGAERSVDAVLAQSLFTPSCGCGTLSERHAERVAALTRDLSAILRGA